MDTDGFGLIKSIKGHGFVESIAWRIRYIGHVWSGTDYDYRSHRFLKHGVENTIHGHTYLVRGRSYLREPEVSCKHCLANILHGYTWS